MRALYMIYKGNRSLPNGHSLMERLLDGPSAFDDTDEDLRFGDDAGDYDVKGRQEGPVCDMLRGIATATRNSPSHLEYERVIVSTVHLNRLRGHSRGSL